MCGAERFRRQPPRWHPSGCKLEQFYQDNRTYENAPACVDDTTSSRHFVFSCPEGGSATGYTLQAQGVDSMADFVYTLDQNNVRATTGVPTGWTTNANCWVTAKGGTC